MRTAIVIKQIHILLYVVACMFLSLCVHESRAQVFILTNDQQLRDLANSPEKEIDNTTGINKSKMSLKQAVEQAKSWHSDQIVIAFDEFFRQYRDDKKHGAQTHSRHGRIRELHSPNKHYTTKNAGVDLRSLYCDEMHIQQDWIYFAHQEDGQFNERFYTDGMGRMLAQKTGMPFDLRYMLYFVNQPLIYKPTVEAILNVEYVLGEKPEDIQRTYLMRDNYYRLLNNHVVDLFVEAKHYGEKLFNREFRTGAHASWAESPTIDKWESPDNTYSVNYEYTPNYLWGNTVHQASAACYDYFKWCDYLQPTGNDFCECGWLDRNYYGAAMAASIGVINKYPNAYAAAWGMPAASYERRMAINYAYGCDPPANIRLITDGVHRDIDVLMLYPMNLVAVDPRFGSWMTQYGYANYLTSDMMLKMGTITPQGKIRVKEKEYGTLVVLYEPLPEQGELDFIEKFLNAGGKVLWMSAPPMLDKGGNNCSAQWQRIFGAKSNYNSANGKAASGKIVKFTGLMKDVEPQTILTDFVVDRIFPVVNENSEVAATCNGEVIGTVRDFPNNGRACFMGCRLRDDQSRSLGYESRNMFEVLNYLGAYPASGTFKNRNDNPSFLSRTGDYFVSSFPNGTTMVVNHYRTHVENWDGNFSRNPEYDAEILKNNPLPTDTIKLYNAAINGHIVSYTGRLSMGFNVKNKRLCSFYGQQCNEITVDGTKYIFSAGKLNDITFGPVNGDLTHYNLYANGAERIEIPVPQTVNGAKATVDGNEISVSVKRGTLVVNLKPEQYGHLVDIHFTNAR